MVFFNKTKEDKMKGYFVGSSQWVLAIKDIFGNEASDLEIEISKNKDMKEYYGILEKVQDIEKYVDTSDNFEFPILVKKIKDIIEEGYNNLVFLNDEELEKRILIIIKRVIEFSLRFEELEGLSSMLKDWIKVNVMTGLTKLLTLNDVFENAEQERSWILISSLVSKKKEVIEFVFGDIGYALIPFGLTSLSKEDLQFMVEKFHQTKEFLFEKDFINNNDIKKIDELIELGVSQNINFHKRSSS